MKTESKTRKKQARKKEVLSYYEQEKSSSEHPASRENAGAKLDVCTEFHRNPRIRDMNRLLLKL